MSRPLSNRLAAGILALLVAPPMPAQEPTPPSPPAASFHETAQVNLVNVEVVVTDKAGRRVAGLRKEEFEIYEDGVLVPITNFFAAESPHPPAAPAAPAAADAADQAPVPVEQRLSLVLFVDNVGVSPAQRNVALTNAAALAESAFKLPSVEVMVVSHGPRTRIYQPFTNSVATTLGALTKLAHEPTDEAGAAAGRDFLTRVMSRTFSSLAVDGSRGARMQDFGVQEARSLLETARGLAQEAYERGRIALASMQVFVSSLAGLPGRKVICYVGNGILMRPGEVYLKEWEARFGNQGIVPGFSADMEANQLSVSPEFHAMVARANADRVTFYSIDALGGSAPTKFSADHEVFDTDPTLAQDEALGRTYSLLYLADATGGAAVVSTPKASAQIAGLAGDFDDFYSLAYAAPHIGDGKNHTIVVKTTHPGVELRYRRRYLDKTADDRMADRTLASLLYDSGSNGLDVGVAIGNEERQKSDVYLVAVLVTVPIGRLALLPKADTREGSLSVWLADADKDERITPPTKHVFPLVFPETAFPDTAGRRLTYAFKFLMRPGAHKLAVSVRDDVGLVDSTVTARFEVGRGGKGGPGAVQGLGLPRADDGERVAAPALPVLAAGR